ncbi:MAG: Biosynthetic arginine decarboxylase, partial [uncultured Gemmatimonadaceae bacterium]
VRRRAAPRDLPAQGERGEAPHAAGGERLHRRLRGGARGVHLPGRRGGAL